MLTATSARVRRIVAIGSIATLGALYPMAAMAQETPPTSGAAVEVGGVVVGQSGGLPTSGVSPARQGLGVTLPRTGGGPADNPVQDVGVVVASGAVLAAIVSTGVYLRRRGVQRRIGG
jgi:hypothetical protein